MKQPLWTLAEAQGLILRVGPVLHMYNVAVGMCGSVLRVGSSRKDLDLILFPFDTSNPYTPVSAMREAGFVLQHDIEAVHARWQRLGTDDRKHVTVWTYEGKRVDVFTFGLGALP